MNEGSASPPVLGSGPEPSVVEVAADGALLPCNASVAEETGI